jgi:SAM-dependent methyltransferase
MKDSPHSYDRAYYESDALDPELHSPRAVVPIVVDLFQPRSVLDVGCGVGRWLTEFRRLGAERIMGIDGPHIDPDWLAIPRDSFRAVDLTEPFQLSDTFDLTVCLEVAEHLPHSSASGLLRSLTQSAPVILFSSAIPSQGGTDHRNEQWPEYWRRLFEREGYKRFDLIRPLIWKDPNVKFWYRQNIFLFASRELSATHPRLIKAAGNADDLMLIAVPVVRELLGLRSVLRLFPKNLTKFVRRRLGFSEIGDEFGS